MTPTSPSPSFSMHGSDPAARHVITFTQLSWVSAVAFKSHQIWIHSTSFKTSSVALAAWLSTLALFQLMCDPGSKCAPWWLTCWWKLHACIPVFLNPSLQSPLCLTNSDLNTAAGDLFMLDCFSVESALLVSIEHRVCLDLKAALMLYILCKHFWSTSNVHVGSSS